VTTERAAVSVVINGAERMVEPGRLLIEAAGDAGAYIPRFCWHKRMSPVGMCRMCLVEVTGPRGTALVASCVTEVADGMRVETGTETVRRAQEAVLEFLLANHPLDCPICDKGGECPLQDQAMSHGPGESRFVEVKRTFEKPVAVSDLVLLDRERCILCARCVRFCDEISGDPLIEITGRGAQAEVAAFPGRPFSSYFSGNTVQICPVGALTAKPYRFRARPWDLQKTQSSSLRDTAHPRIEIHSSQGEILRFDGVDNEAVSHGWLSDKARFGFEHIGSEERLTSPLARRGGELEEVGWAEAIGIVAERLDHIRRESGGEALAALGGARGTNEDAYALSKFVRAALDANNVDARMGDALSSHFLSAVVDRAVIGDLDEADTIFVWGPDLKEEHPTLYLRARRAAQRPGAVLIVAHPRATGLDDAADVKLTYRPGDGQALLDDLAGGGRPDVMKALSAEKVVALVGMASHADGPHLAESAAALARRTAGQARLLPLNSRGNTYGALDMGLAPDLLPGRVALGPAACARLAETWGEFPSNPGRDAPQMFEGLVSGDLRGLLLVGADPARDMTGPSVAAAGLEAAEFAVSIDLFLNDSNRGADVILPAAAFAEKAGTATNVEGRVQKLNRAVPPAGQSRPDWQILDDIAAKMGRPISLVSAEAVASEIAAVAPAYEGLSWNLLEESREGVVVPVGGAQPLEHIPVAVAAPETVPEAADPEAADSELALHVAKTMYDDGALLRRSPSTRGLAPGPVAHLNPEDAHRLGAREGGAVRLSTDRGEGELTVAVDEGTPPGTVYVPFNQPGGPRLGPGPAVRVRVL